MSGFLDREFALLGIVQQTTNCSMCVFVGWSVFSGIGLCCKGCVTGLLFVFSLSAWPCNVPLEKLGKGSFWLV
jgi:hypothetical protein